MYYITAIRFPRARYGLSYSVTIIFSNKVLGEMIDLQSNRSYQMLNNFNLYYGLNNLIRIKLKDKTSFHFMLFSGMF